MSNKTRKIYRSFLLGVLLFTIASLEANMALAGIKRPRRTPEKKTIAEFLSSLELGKHSYAFDHNADGVSDMYVYPLITSVPDLKTKYITLEEAARKQQVILKEDLGNRSLNKKDPPSSFNIVAQMMGYRPSYGSGSRYGSGYGSGSGGSMYYPRGGMIGGGWQSRGFPTGGVLGGGSGRGGYRGSSGVYMGFGFKDGGFDRHDFKTVVAMGESGFADAKLGPGQNTGSSEPADKLEVEVSALCFEKWRLIEESRRMGDSEYFSYLGMASPHVRKELVLFPNQTNVDKVIAKELRELGVLSKTSALADVFKNEDVKKIIDYYRANSREVPGKNKGISGIIVTDRNKILCADVYSSPGLFRKMFSQLMQSAALGVCRTDEKSRKDIAQGDVEKFFRALKRIEKFKRESSQTYRLFYPKIIGGVELLSDKDGTKVVHLEAYPRQ